MLSGSAREATTRQQKQLNKFSCFLNRELRYNCSIARSELFTSCGRFRGGFRPSRPHGTNVLGCDASLWIALSAAPHTSLVGGMTKITDHWLGRQAMFQQMMQQMSDGRSNNVGAALDDSGNLAQTNSRTELDTHANMPVVGKQCFILAETGKTVDTLSKNSH